MHMIMQDIEEYKRMLTILIWHPNFGKFIGVYANKISLDLKANLTVNKS